MLELPPLPDGTVLLVEVGSTAHGTGPPGGEDHDEMGVVIETPAQVLGLEESGMRSVMQRSQPEGSRSGPDDADRTLHSLRRFLRLATTGNPSILMTFWAPVQFATNDGRDLQGLGPSLVGRHVIPRYRGYMKAQAERLLGIRGRSGHGRRGGGREELVGQFGYDTKYAIHCARLGFQCLELLSTDRLSLPMEGEPAEWLLNVRKGLVTFDEWWERTLGPDAALEKLERDESLRAGPDAAAVEAWSIEVPLRHWH